MDDIEENESDSHHEAHFESTNSFQHMHTQGRERGKWVVNVVDSNGKITEEHLNAPDVWGMENRKIILEFGPNNQPEGGSGGLFGTWLGQLSNDLNKLPIAYEDWRKVQSWRKDDIWDFIQSKFQVDTSSDKYKKFIMKSLSQKCKGLKTRLWRSYRRNTPEEAIEARPDFVSKEQWQDFVHLKFTEKAKKLRERNVKNRSHHKIPHTLGKKSIARKSKEIFIKTGKRPSRAEIFVFSRQKADGSFVNEEARELSDKLAEKRTQNTGNTSNVNDEFSQVFGAERPGRVRCVGLGPTLSTFFQSHPTTTATSEAEVIMLRNQVGSLTDQVRKLHEFVTRFVGEEMDGI